MMSAFVLWLAGFIFTINYCKIEIDEDDEPYFIAVGYLSVFITWPAILGKALRAKPESKKRTRSAPTPGE